MSVSRPCLFAGCRAIKPVPIEAAIRDFMYNRKLAIVDAAVTAVGKKKERRLVAYIVLRGGLIREEIEQDLAEYLKYRGLKPWERPKAYAQVSRIPRDADGAVKRMQIRRGEFRDGRRFLTHVAVRQNGTRVKPKTVLIRNPVNEIRFEGVVALPPRRNAQKEVVLSVSHQRPRSKPLRVSFVFDGKLKYQAEKLEVNTRVSVLGVIEGVLRFKGVDFSVIKPSTARQKEVSLADTDGLLERLL